MSKPALKILLAAPRGFCAGVVRAIDIVERALEVYGAPVYVRHEIVHNKFVVDGLKGQQEVVVKGLDPAVTGEAPVVAGATIMGDGRVVLILDVAALFEGKRRARLGSEPEPVPLAEGRT